MIHFTTYFFCSWVLSYQYARKVLEYYLVLNVFVMPREEWKPFMKWVTSSFGLGEQSLPKAQKPLQPLGKPLVLLMPARQLKINLHQHSQVVQLCSYAAWL